MRFIKTKQAAALAGVSRETLKRLRLEGELIEGVHWRRLGSRVVLFDQDLFEHWLATRNCPELHEARIDEYLKNLEIKGA
ncbi:MULTISPECIES: helix-turn-helix domain-containing protein [unclassified Leptolyngbya]|uniref:helix-turn-helix transcriptional regulator n=1 Tax=unclassified Leptolyngbya TaxID=2650499 RepID=UPI00168778B5|nr:MULTISPECIES: helix-turn-helix domain-containing protein [unclassified Leptolyngbya]MBD1913607.1 helix-turn-helix domain-containing protein [Leptolyngbya sp. FACHB-8]MBD2154062.1 helix-turn-helix domain-containing protein [Leptolyngbya sp. FACHB-16]